MCQIRDPRWSHSQSYSYLSTHCDSHCHTLTRSNLEVVPWLQEPIYHPCFYNLCFRDLHSRCREHLFMELRMGRLGAQHENSVSTSPPQSTPLVQAALLLPWDLCDKWDRGKLAHFAEDKLRPRGPRKGREWPEVHIRGREQRAWGWGDEGPYRLAPGGLCALCSTFLESCGSWESVCP